MCVCVCGGGGGGGGYSKVLNDDFSSSLPIGSICKGKMTKLVPRASTRPSIVAVEGGIY